MYFALILAVIGATISTLRRYASRGNGLPFWRILINDFQFRKFATINLLTFLNAVAQGAGFGLSLGFFIAGYMRQDINIERWVDYCAPSLLLLCTLNWQEYYILSLVALLGIVAIRISIESYILIFKSAQVFISRFETENGDQ